MKYLFVTFIVLLYLSFLSPVQSQMRTIIHDGVSGMEHCHILDDTVVILDVIRKSPAWEAGIRQWDKIIFINDSLVSKKGLTLRDVNELLFDTPGEPIMLQIIRDGIDSMMNFILIRDRGESPHQWLDYEYLPDSSGLLTFEDVLTDSINQLFTNVLDAKLRIFSVEEGSMAYDAGLKPGDHIFSLFEALDNHNYLSIDFDNMAGATEDTTMEIMRDSVEVRLKLNPKERDAFLGVTSKFGTDFMQSCVWIKLKMSSRISSDQTYLLKCHSAADSILLFEESNLSDHIVRKASVLLPKDQKDFSYKDWEAIRIHLKKGQEQTFYIQLNRRDGPIYIPWLEMIPLDTVSKYDRMERVILASFAGMMLLICFYYLIMFFSTRRKHFLFYPFFILSFLILLLYDWGYYAEFISGQAYKSINDVVGLIYALPVCFFLLFGIYYLDLRTNLKVWYRIAIIDLWVLVGSNIILNGYVLLTTKVEGFNAFTLFLEIIWVVSSFVIPIALLLIVTILRLIRGFKPAWYFLTAYLVLALTFLFQETRPGEFDNAEIHISNFRIIIENSALLLGAILQFLIFSLGLARKMKLDEAEKKLTEGKIIEQLKENEKLKDKVNRELEGKVRERTREISEQKEEIESQRDEIEAQRYEVETQRDEVEAQRDQLETQRDLVVEQKDEIIDSINYAKRIQSAMLPPETYVTELLNENFIFYKPRDIVSGDFYWIKHVNQYIVLLAADCTGHGVPGALMSMLGISYLNEIVQRREITQANQILNELRKQIKHSLRQHGQPDEAKDGIDMALCVLDLRNMLMQYSGANNPLYLIRDVDDIPDLKEIKADRMPIGYYQGKDKTFTNHNIQLQIGDTFYIFSDGFIDQKGGKENKKFMNKNFKKLLLEIHDQPMYDQKDILDKALSDWMGSNSQMDDILVIGVRM